MYYSVSVVIPTYNRSLNILKNAINSVLNQKYPIYEILIVDDNKDDNLLLSESIKEFCSTNNLIYMRSFGVGAARARNIGIKIAKGDFIAFLDDDDVWFPNKLAAQMPLFTTTSVGLVYSRGYTITMSADGTSSKSYYATDEYYKTEVNYNDLLTKNYIGTTTQLVVRKDILNNIGGFDENLPTRQDYDLCIRVAKHYRCIGSNEYLFEHYIHSMGQITSNHFNNRIGYEMLLNKYKKDIYQVNGAYQSFCYRIARHARLNRDYGILLKYIILIICKNPRKAFRNIKKCFK